MFRTLFCISIITILCWTLVIGEGLIEVFKWKQMDFYNRGDTDVTTSNPQPPIITNPGNRKTGDVIYFPDQNAQSRIKRYGKNNVMNRNRQNPPSYIPYNNIPMGVTHYKDRLFVTMPRRRAGIPSTLNYIDLQKDGNQPSPKLHAYPNYEINQVKANSNHLVSVYRTSTDGCGRLWFIDTGALEYPDDLQQVQKPSIWIIDLKSDSLIKRFEIPSTIAEEGHGLASITVDTDKGCDKAFAYIPDLVHNELYVYNFASNDIWAFEHNYFHFDPLAGDMTIGGQSFSWNDGIFSITLGPKEKDGSRNVMFHPMASNNEFFVNSAVLQNKTYAESGNYNQDFRLLGKRGDDRQSTMHEYDPATGVVFYAEIQRNGVGCWNTAQRFSADTHGTVAQDAQRMIYPGDLTIDDDSVLWIMTNSMPIFIYSTLDTNTYNFRIWKQKTDAAITNTQCANN